MVKEKYNEICEMWAKATKKVIAPQGFKDNCEFFIDAVMANELKTDKFYVFDDKYCTGIRYIKREPTMHGRGNFLLKYNIDGKDICKHDLDDEVLFDMTKTIYEFVTSHNFDFVSCRDDEEYGNVPTRDVDELAVEPILNDNLLDEYVDDNGIYHCDMSKFYECADDELVKGISYQYDLMKQLFEKYIDNSHLIIGKKLNYNDKTLRSIAFYYLYRELDATDNYEYEFPCGDTLFEVHSVPTDMGDNVEFENARINNVHLGMDGSIIFCFSNGREEELNEIFIDYLWQVLYAIEYNKYPRYEETNVLGYELKVSTPDNYVEKAEKFIYHAIYDVLKSSRWGNYHSQRLMLMDDKNNPLGFFYDVVCKRNKVVVEYYTNTYNPFEITFDVNEGDESVECIDLKDLSPISIKHLVTYIGYGIGIDKETNKDYSHIHTYEEWNDIVGVRVPYRIVNGKKVTFAATCEDEEMKELAQRGGIESMLFTITSFFDISTSGLELQLSH